MSNQHHTHAVEPVETPVSIRHFVDTLAAYVPVIILSLVAIAIGYTLLTVALYLTAAEQRLTLQPFRLDFKGATEGKYPNGTPFSATDIIGTRVLLQVYRANELDRFCQFSAFSRSIFVLEYNRAYENLVNEYQSRLSDPKLTTVDRERIQREFDQKRSSLPKNEYAIHFVRTKQSAKIPPQLVPKILTDILSSWATFAINEQHVSMYRVSMLTPAVVDETSGGSSDPIVSIVVLRAKMMRVFENIHELSQLPAAELARTKEGHTLTELSLRLEDILRFRLDPLIGRIRSQGLLANPAATIRFVESQIAYDQRRLAAAQETAAAIREALAVYSRPMERQRGSEGTPPLVNGQQPATRSENETVMPQLSEGFLERLVSLTSLTADAAYRQKLVEEYRKAVTVMIPLQQAVSYDQLVLDQSRGAAARNDAAEAAQVRQEIEAARSETKALIGKVNEIYVKLSSALNPSTELYTLGGTPLTRTVRSVRLDRLALYGVLLLVLSIPVIIAACLLHNRMREETRNRALAEGELAHA